jgi:hypothetical protein
MSAQPSSSSPEQDVRQKALNTYRRKLLEHREMEAKVKERKLVNYLPCSNSFKRMMYIRAIILLVFN